MAVVASGGFVLLHENGAWLPFDMADQDRDSDSDFTTVNDVALPDDGTLGGALAGNIARWDGKEWTVFEKGADWEDDLYFTQLDVAPDGAMRVVDYKTGRSPSELFEAKALFQMKFYALVLWRIHGTIPALLQLVYLGNGEVVRYSPDERDLLAVERNVRAIWDAVANAARTGDWRPRTSKLCDWCDFKDLCPAWGGTPPPLPQGAGLLALDPARSGEAVPADD